MRTLPSVVVCLIWPALGWAQFSGEGQERPCDPEIENCPPPPVTSGPPGPAATGLPFGAESFALLANRKRDREAENDRAKQAWSSGIHVASADDSWPSLITNALPSRWAYWGSVLRTENEGTAADFEYESRTNTALAGIERIMAHGHVAGLALGFGEASGALFFEQAQLDSEEGLAVLYGAYLLNAHTLIDAAVSYSQTRVSRRVAASAADARGGYSGHRRGATLNVSQFVEVGGLALSGQIGYLATQEWQPQYELAGDASSSQTVKARRLAISQFSISFEMAYPAWARGEVFAGAGYRYDAHRSREDLVARGASGDEDEFDMELGARHRCSEYLTLSVALSHTAGRRGFSGDIGQVTLRWEP